MDAILAPERDMKGSLEVKGAGGGGVQGCGLHLAGNRFKRNLAGLCFICTA